MKRIKLSSQNIVVDVGQHLEDDVRTIIVEDTVEAYKDCQMRMWQKEDGEIDTLLEDPYAFEEKRKQKWDEVRAIRNSVLATTDWTQLPDVTMSDSDSTAWTTYRQELRDMIDEDTNPFAVTWPEKPV